PFAMVRSWTVNLTPEFTENTRTVLPPLMVTTFAPSIVVSTLMVFWLVTVIVTEAPQEKVTVPSKFPPPGRQVFNAASVQLALVPVPTTHAMAHEVGANTAKARSAGPSTSRVWSPAGPCLPPESRVDAALVASDRRRASARSLTMLKARWLRQD